MMEFKVIIEHLEPCINKWLLKEYEYAKEIYGSRLTITNVKDLNHLRILSKYVSNIRMESATELLKDSTNVIVLDPKASTPLEISDLRTAQYVIVGGIMGSHPPKGRTWLYITSKLKNAKPRNIGLYQYTIAGAIYVLKRIEMGTPLQNIKFVHGLSFKKEVKGVELEIFLPYAFPIDDEGRVVLPRDYIETVAEHMIVYEQRILSGGDNDVCYNR